MKKFIVFFCCLCLLLPAFGCAKNQKKILKVGFCGELPPFRYYCNNDKNDAVAVDGKEIFLNGYDVKIAEKIKEKCEYDDVVFYEYSKVDLKKALENGAVDCVISALDEKETVGMSLGKTEPYYYTALAVIVKKGSGLSGDILFGNLEGKRVSCINLSRCNKVSEIKNVKKIPEAESFGEMLELIRDDICDAVICDRATALAAHYSGSDVRYKSFFHNEDDFSKVKDEIRLCIALSNSELKEKINSVLSMISVDEMDKTMETAREEFDDYFRSKK